MFKKFLLVSLLISFNAFAVGPRSEVWLQGGNGQGSGNFIKRFLTVQRNIGPDFTYTDSATLGATITVNAYMLAAAVYCDYYNPGQAHIGMSVNSNQLSTDIANINPLDTLGFINSNSSNLDACITVTKIFNVGDVIRAHGQTTGVPSGTDVSVTFHVTEISN